MERTYIIPLKQATLKAPKYKRAKKAVNEVKAFLVKHMKSDNVKLGKLLNEKLWENGIRNPPNKVKITVLKEDDGLVKAELFGHKYVDRTPVEEKKGGLKERLGLGKKEEKPEDIKDKLKELKETAKKASEEKSAEIAEKVEKEGAAKKEEKAEEPKKADKPAEKKESAPKEEPKPVEKKESAPEKKEEPKKADKPAEKKESAPKKAEEKPEKASPKAE